MIIDLFSRGFQRQYKRREIVPTKDLWFIHSLRTERELERKFRKRKGLRVWDEESED